MIRMIRQDAMCAIQLFSQHDPHQSVWKRQSRQRPFEIAPLQDFRREAIGSADQKGEIAPVLQASGEPRRQLAGRHFFAALIESHHELARTHSRENPLTLGFDGLGRGTAQFR